MPMPIKSSLAACAVGFALSLSAQSPAAAEPQQLPEACYSGTRVIHNGISYANKCVTWTYGYGRNRCTRWLPVACGGGIFNRRS
jgi:hypothetical protein